MSSVKVAISMNRAIQAAVAEKLARMERSRLAAECAKLDPKFEKALAEASARTCSTSALGQSSRWR